MLNKTYYKKNLDLLKKNLKNRNFEFDLEHFLELEKEVSQLQVQIEQINQQKNTLNEKMKNAVSEKNTNLINELKEKSTQLKNQLSTLEESFSSKNEEFKKLELSLPNILDDSVHFGMSEEENKEIKRISFNHKKVAKPLAHWEIAAKKELCLYEKATKIAGSRFVLYKNKGAMLINALMQLTIDTHTESGFDFYLLPTIVNRNNLFNTGQLPKFEEDLFKVTDTNFYLSSTLEVQLVNLHANEIINGQTLPFKYCSTGVNYRKESGTYGKDTKGNIRLHQFYKTELVLFTKPNESDHYLEVLTTQAEKILNLLELDYRRILLCSTDTSFASAKTYDIEVFLPSYGTYKEISSCSNCKDFQANRGKIRYKDEEGNIHQVHTLNGTGIAIDRLFAAVLENYQDENGDVIVPKALSKYLNFKRI